ncbi:MAG: thiamine pyrophosphate-dependent enzyme, partial [Minisyncoccales bacterium]
EEKIIKRENLVMVTGIGCHGKIFDYLNMNGFYALHGRGLPVAFGLKMANKNLKVLVFSGDGDLCAEGLSHFIHTCRYNLDISLFLHQNQVYGLTTGQITPTSEKGFKGPSNFFEKREEVLNPLLLALLAGASFVARAFALDINELKEIAKRAILHSGFSLVEILQPCITYHNNIAQIQKQKYYLSSPQDLQGAIEKAREWDYGSDDKKIPLGIFFEEKKMTFEERFPQLKEPWYLKEKKQNVDLFKEFK